MHSLVVSFEGNCDRTTVWGIWDEVQVIRKSSVGLYSFLFKSCFCSHGSKIICICFSENIDSLMLFEMHPTLLMPWWPTLFAAWGCQYVSSTSPKSSIISKRLVEAAIFPLAKLTLKQVLQPLFFSFYVNILHLLVKWGRDGDLCPF